MASIRRFEIGLRRKKEERESGRLAVPVADAPRHHVATTATPR
jgi:hypothetical protein